MKWEVFRWTPNTIFIREISKHSAEISWICFLCMICAWCVLLWFLSFDCLVMWAKHFVLVLVDMYSHYTLCIHTTQVFISSLKTDFRHKCKEKKKCILKVAQSKRGPDLSDTHLHASCNGAFSCRTFEKNASGHCQGHKSQRQAGQYVISDQHLTSDCCEWRCTVFYSEKTGF